ncbi:MAG: type II toxin-antitoxin system RelE family toxin [Gammaproteobacteria bacterium]
MTWTVIYHPDVPDDLRRLGRAEAGRVVAAIDKRIRHGEPDKFGKLLRHDLAGCRRIRVGETRIVFRVDARAIEVLVIAVGPRRDDEIYLRAGKRSRSR